MLDETTSGSLRQPGNVLQSFKAPPIIMFSGRGNYCAFIKVKGVIFSVRRVARLAGNQEEGSSLELAVCQLIEKAASWITRLEAENRMQNSIDDSYKAMMDEFIPANEKIRARIKLISIKKKQSIYQHIEEF